MTWIFFLNRYLGLTYNLVILAIMFAPTQQVRQPHRPDDAGADCPIFAEVRGIELLPHGASADRVHSCAALVQIPEVLLALISVAHGGGSWTWLIRPSFV